MKTNIHKIASILIMLTVCSLTHAQLLWRVSGNGLEKPSFIFGTHHVAPPSMLNSIEEFSSALSACDAVYGEIEEDQLSSASTLQRVAQMVAAPADSTLSHVIDSRSLAVLDSILMASTQGVLSAAALEGAKPAFVSTQLAMMLTIQQFPEFNPTEQLDIIIQSRAKALGKEIHGFETAEFQYGLLFGQPISEQAAALQHTLANIEESKRDVARLSDAYKAQNLAGIEALAMEEFNDSEITAEERERQINALLYQRNAAWVETLLQVMPRQSVFVAVGAAHLVGEKGVIALLRAKGYTLTPMH